LLTIAGPTAVGKTDLVLKLAKQYNSEIFSCDSRQIYKEMNIGTAKPSASELAMVNHHFIDHKSISEYYSAGMFERDFDQLSTAYFENNDIGILTGGTGMYIRAAIEGLDFFPPVIDDVREKYNKLLDDKKHDELIALLQEKDPTYAAEVDINNFRRIARALEVTDSGDHPYSFYLKNNEQKKELHFTPIRICLTRPREELYDRINKRVDIMVENGLFDEVKQLIPMRHHRALETVGYTELFDHIDGKTSFSEAIELIKRNSRRYSKRQMTWYRNQGSWKMIPAENFDDVVAYIEESINTED